MAAPVGVINSCGFDLSERNSFQDFEGRWCGQGKVTMLAVDRAGAVVQRGDKDLFHAQRFDARARADDIGDRVQPADFVELHFVHRLTMNFGLRGADAVENGECVLLYEFRELAFLQEYPDRLVAAAMFVTVLVFVVMMLDLAAVIMVVRVRSRRVMFVTVTVGVLVLVLVMLVFFLVMMMLVLVGMFMTMFVPVLMLVGVFVRMLVFVMRVFVVMMLPLAMMVVFVLIVRVGRAFVDTEFHALDLLPLLAFEVHLKNADVELREFPFEGRRFDAEVNEGAHGHVAGDAGKAVEEEVTFMERERKGKWLEC